MGTLCFTVFIGSVAGPTFGQKRNDPKEHLKYQRCILLSKTDPDAAFDMSLAWQDFGGGEAAGHCIAAALVGLKIYNEAALRFETLAQSSRNDAPVRAGMLSQAAQAWLLDGNLERAQSILNAAILIQPDDPQLYVDRAVVYAEMKKFKEAIQDLSAALKRDQTLVDGYVFRASAYRRLKKLTPATSDIEQALRLDPKHSAGLLERGILRRIAGDKVGARKDWLHILKIAPGTPAAQSAQSNLEKMDVKK
jgi:tetratricopeptide (TPR) repeat protein